MASICHKTALMAGAHSEFIFYTQKRDRIFEPLTGPLRQIVSLKLMDDFELHKISFRADTVSSLRKESYEPRIT